MSLSLKDQINQFIDRLDHFAVLEVEREYSGDDCNATNVGIRMLDTCLKVMWPDYMRWPIEYVLNAAGVEFNDPDTRKYEIFDKLLGVLMFSSEVTQVENMAIAKIDEAIETMSTICCVHFTPEFKKSMIDAAANMIGSTERDKFFTSVATELYRNEDGPSLSELAQCYRDLVVDEERLQVAVENLQSLINGVHDADADTPFIIERKDYENYTSHLAVCRTWTLFDLVKEHNDDAYDLAITSNCDNAMDHLIAKLLDHENSDDPKMKQIVKLGIVMVLDATPASVVSQDFKTDELLFRILFTLFPGRTYKVIPDDGGETICMVHILSREEIFNIVHETLTEHRRLTAKAMEHSAGEGKNPSTIKLSIFAAIHDIAEKIYGNSTIAKYVMTYLLAYAANHGDVFNVNMENLVDAIMAFSPKRKLASTNEDLIAQFREILASMDEFDPKEEETCNCCGGCEDCGNSDDDLKPQGIVDTSHWSPATVAIALPNLHSKLSRFIGPDDFELLISASSYPEHRKKACKSVGFNLSVVGKLLGDAVKHHSLDTDLEPFGTISNTMMPIVFTPLCAARRLTLNDVASVMPPRIRDPKAFASAAVYRIPGFNKFIEEHPGEKNFRLDKKDLCNLSNTIYQCVEETLKHENKGTALYPRSPLVVTTVAEAIQRVCFDMFKISETDTYNMLEIIRSCLKRTSFRSAVSALEIHASILATILMLIPINYFDCEAVDEKEDVSK